MTTPDKDGWITHDGGPCPVAPEMLVQLRQHMGGGVFSRSIIDTADVMDWSEPCAYRIFVPAHTVTPGPSPFVRETAARIMAAMSPPVGTTDNDLAYYATHSVRAAQALEDALKGAGE
jgi:hypothetical protein